MNYLTSRHIKYKRLEVGNDGVLIMLIKRNYLMGWSKVVHHIQI